MPSHLMGDFVPKYSGQSIIVGTDGQDTSKDKDLPTREDESILGFLVVDDIYLLKSTMSYAPRIRGMYKVD